MRMFRREEQELGLVFTGPIVLVPLWRAHGWWVSRWIGHDCDKQPITRHLPCSFRPFKWLDRWVLDTWN